MGLVASVFLIMMLMMMTTMTSVMEAGASETEETLRNKMELRAILRRYERDPNRDSTEHVIFLKTHKTGSTTLGGILSRWAARHGKHACCKKPHVQAEKSLRRKVLEGRKYDLFLNHFAMWHRKPNDMHEILNMLHDIVSNRASVVSSMREPVTHFASFYNFFIRETRHEPKGGSLYDFARTSKFKNPLASDFGINMWSEALKLLEVDLKDTTWVLQDHYVESLVALRRAFNWDMADLLFIKPAYSTRARGGFRRYDGHTVRSTMSIKEMSPELLKEIERSTDLDRAL